jgi:hypothetical protein
MLSVGGIFALLLGLFLNPFGARMDEDILKCLGPDPYNAEEVQITWE